MSLSPELVATLEKVTTATITTMLLKKGIRHCWMSGPMPFSGGTGKRIVGPAFTLALRAGARGPGDAGELGRADLDARRDRGDAGGLIAVADAMGVTTAGIFGDILCMRMVRRGVKALVTDGVVRDKAGVVRPACRPGARARPRRHR